MEYRRKFLTAFGLILLLLVGKISIFDEENVEKSRVEETKIKPLTFEDDICSLYDNSLLFDFVLFERKYKPLVVIIADKFIDGINRVRNLNGSKRILNDKEIKHYPYYSQLYKIMLENIYLFEVNDTYYFIYPVDFQDHLLTIYSQKKLLKGNLGITFDFVNVKKESPFYEDILIPLEPSCTNCALVKYVNEKLRKGESFSELFELRKQLFREKKTKNLSFNVFDNDNICASMGFNLNSKGASSLLRFNSLLKQIQTNSKSVKDSKKKSIVERSLICFQSRDLKKTEGEFLRSIANKHYLKDIMAMIDYLNWINSTISSLKSNDNSFGGLCENEHKIEIIKLFCFMKKKSDVTSHNVTAWIDALKQNVAKTLKSKLKWFNKLIYLYKNEYTMSKNEIVRVLNYLKQETLNVTVDWKDVMTITHEHVEDSLSEITNYNYKTKYNTICTIYEHWKTIDNLLLEMKFKKLVIIVVDDMKQGIRIAKQIRASRVVPKVKREDLYYTEQFLYDTIMKHIYLVQLNNIHYYVYPMTTNRHRDSLISYVEYKMISDYSKVVYYFVNFKNYFSLGERIGHDYNDSVIPDLPDFCNTTSEKCKTRFINPSYLIDLHQKFYYNFPHYLPFFVTFHNNLTEFINNNYSHYKNEYYPYISQQFYDFVKQQQISYDTNYLFTDLSCLSSRKLNNRTDIDFSMTNLVDIMYFHDFIYYAYSNITSINDTDNTNLYSLCSNREIFKFLKFFCFLKINYIHDMLKVTDQKSVHVSNMKSIVNNEKNLITKYLKNTSVWLHKLFLMQFNDYKYNETLIFVKSDALYSVIPKITSNGADLSNKIYSILKKNKISLQCTILRNITENPMNTLVISGN
ncbi:uncharacterized protein LOC122510632 [Leptopilina heterotoma]|uniref:uncharacterized protein LOC122510632 n=1 Tax=Leptopilina heterotoma TaxID=63436 RepID=UPI001CA7EB3D|nr:uncharacterized protein LOC122510632 [Leptopilina heterotoma]